MPGFNFDNVQRNLQLQDSGAKQPKVLKTGTTIVGVVFSGGVILGADTRSTEGDTVADKRCKKIHYMAPNIMCCGAGTAADTEMVTQMISAQLTLNRLESGRQSRVIEALTRLKRLLYRYQGHIGAALVLGGVDVEGSFLATVAPHGSTDRLPFVTMGSGSIAAMAVLESAYKDGMTRDEAVSLVTHAVCAGILNDPYSGSLVDICEITAAGTKMFLGHHIAAQRVHPKQAIVFPPGTALVTKEEVRRLVNVTDVPLQED
jgi:20S proteasome subunit beta 2